ncbi:MAG: hypothetical protein JXR10_05685 [Cyclobacteriaceae bacterium]
MKTHRLYTLLLISISIILISACSEDAIKLDETVPVASSKIDISVFNEMTIYPNNEPIRIILEVVDQEFEITSVQIEINDSIVHLPSSVENRKTPFTYAFYTWYNEETLPTGDNTIIVTAYDSLGEAYKDSLHLEIEDFRNKYVGNYLFTAIDNCSGDTSTVQFEGWIKALEDVDITKFEDKFSDLVRNWEGPKGPKRRMAIHFKEGQIVTPVFSLSNPVYGVSTDSSTDSKLDVFNYVGGWGIHLLIGEFSNTNSIRFHYLSGSCGGKYSRSYTTIHGVKNDPK